MCVWKGGAPQFLVSKKQRFEANVNINVPQVYPPGSSVKNDPYLLFADPDDEQPLVRRVQPSMLPQVFPPGSSVQNDPYLSFADQDDKQPSCIQVLMCNNHTHVVMCSEH